MSSIFTSPKKLIMETQIGPQILQRKFRDRIGGENELECLVRDVVWAAEAEQRGEHS